MTRSIVLHPQLGCQAVGFAHGEGPGWGWGWEPLSCPTLRESDPICSGCLSAAACPSTWVSLCPDVSLLVFFGIVTCGALCSPAGMDPHCEGAFLGGSLPFARERSPPLQGWGQIGAGKGIQVPKEQEAGAAEQDLSSPCSAPCPEPPSPTQESKAPSKQEPLMLFASSKASLGPTPPFPHWQISLSKGGEGFWGPGWIVPSYPHHSWRKGQRGPWAAVQSSLRNISASKSRGELFVTHRFP